MKTQDHVFTSTLLSGGLYVTTQSLEIAIPCFLSGIFIDIDHVFDFIIFSKDKFSIKNIFTWCNDLKWEKLYLIFHSYEILFILGIIIYFFPDKILLGIFLGSGLHLIQDQIGNCYFRKKFTLSNFFYFFIYRFFVGFRKEKMLRFRSKISQGLQ